MTETYIIAAIAAVAIVAAAMLYRRLAATSAQLTELSVDNGKKQTELDMRSEQMRKAHEALQAATQRLAQAEAEGKALTAKAEAQAREIEMLRKQADSEAELREKRFEEQLRTAKEQMANMAQQVLERNAEKLKEQNTESMGHITQPLRDAMTEVKRVIGESIKGSERNTATLQEHIKRMMETSVAVGEKAESLANVLRRDNKAAGNMGEIILGDLLASQGLTEGIHYEVQARLRDEMGQALKNDDTGREMQPDVILHYPNGQDAIIDSKVSLKAYSLYVGATTPEEKDKHLQDHLRSVRQHVAELARKDYSKYIRAPRTAVDFVIMFVPFESSLQLALANDPTLWREAFEKKVFITGEQNLLGILHIIHIAWVQNQQAENQAKVFDVAAQLLDRLGDLVARHKAIGDALEKTRKAYDYASNKLFTGNQSVVKKGRELVELGTKENANRKIPAPQDETLLIEPQADDTPNAAP